MSNIWLKRIGLGIISLIVGFVVTWAAVTASFILNTTLSDYGAVYTIFTILSVACATGIWLDKFMGTDILPK